MEVEKNLNVQECNNTKRKVLFITYKICFKFSNKQVEFVFSKFL